MYDVYIVRRTQIYLDELQSERLAREAADTGVTMSALIRRAIDAYLDDDGPDDARLARFRSAVRESAGTVPDLPPGESYVDSLRPDYAERERKLWRKARSELSTHRS